LTTSETKNKELDARFETIAQAAKLWRAMESQKEWHFGQPEILRVLDGAITRLRLLIILEARGYHDS
jgi:hypothetical protein